MKRKKMTTKELHQRMAGACKHCNKPKKEHLPIMVPDDVEWRCLDGNTTSRIQRRVYTP